MIAVVMPAYNAEPFVALAIESILKQTYACFEFIIVDDQSRDGTRRIVDRYAREDGRIRVVNGPHRGPGAAMNVGVQAASREWIVVMHADDVALPERLERQLAWAKSAPDVVIWGSGGYRIDREGRLVSHFLIGPTDEAACHALRERSEIVQAIHSTVMMKRITVLKVGGYDDTLAISNSGAEDIELFDRMLVHGPLVTIPEELMLYRIHGTSQSVRKHQAMHEMAAFVKERQRHRVMGLDLDFDKFQRAHRHRPLRKRLNDHRVRAAGFQYRQAGMAYCERNYFVFIWRIGLAFLFSPSYVAMRLWEQALSPSSRRKLAIDRP